MLEISHIQKKFVKHGRKAADLILQDVSVTVQAGEFFTLLGPSGCGKTTLLRILAGLETPTEGKILFKGQDLTSLPPQVRPFHMVFQKHALFPHLSVAENVAFGLKIRRRPATEISEKVKKALALVKLSGFENRLPETLSGGQSQRVALARALVNEPQVLLLDEPLSALDQKLREDMQTELRLLQKKLGITFVYVTHDQQEAFSLSDRVGVMNHGRFEQVSAPEELYTQPQSFFTARFVGASISLAVQGEVKSQNSRFEFSSYGQKLSAGKMIGEGNSIFALVRPEKVTLAKEEKSDLNHIPGTILQVAFRGASSEIQVQIAPETWVPVLIDVDKFHVLNPQVGQAVHLLFRPEDTTLFRDGVRS